MNGFLRTTERLIVKYHAGIFEAVVEEENGIILL